MKRQAVSAQSADYLIIADPLFAGGSSSLDSLVRFHRNNGLTVTVKNVDSIGSSCGEIRNYIKSVYFSAVPAKLKYLLFAGNQDKIPVYRHWYNDRLSDLWYGCMDGDSDIVADVAIGRLPASTENGLATMISKTLAWRVLGSDLEKCRNSVGIAIFAVI